MRVLYVYKDYYPVVGGIENHIRLICRGLKAGWPEVEPTAEAPSETVCCGLAVLRSVVAHDDRQVGAER